MYLVLGTHSPDYLKSRGLGIEVMSEFIDGESPRYREYAPYIKGIHLPYSNINIAAFDKDEREHSIAVLEENIEQTCRMNIPQMVIHSSSFETRDGKCVGEYTIMIESFRKIADFAAARKVVLCLENMVLREPWKRRMYCDSAREWYQVREDIGRDNVMLTLDTSHAASSVTLFQTAAERFSALYDFLAHPEYIIHLHWSDARLTANSARYMDMHLLPGQGDLPRDFQRQLKHLDAVITLEQGATDGQRDAALDFIARL